MKNNNRSFILLLFLGLMLASCATGSKMGGSSKNCGCGLHKGFVGY